ncbi:MAG: FAD-dependent oxidoreductase [Brevinematales bacterium]|nr:FAD-dependent oxidoreductase [Brevinematales bacterium]
MEKKADVLVIGGGPAGIISAVTAKKYYPGKSFIVLRDVENGVVPCGIPYMIQSLENPEQNKMGMMALEKNGIEAVVDKALKIDRKSKKVECASGNTYTYDKLILAMGSNPMKVSIPGIDKKGVYPILKDMGYLKEMVAEVKKGKNTIIIGGGFIGIEFADELSRVPGMNTTLVEVLPELLANSFDTEFSKMVEEKLLANKVTIKKNVAVKEIKGGDKIEKVVLSDGTELPADSLILGIGAVPNSDIARDTGLFIGRKGGIWVDEYMRTDDSDIFAVGDCAEKKDFYTRKVIPVMLASTATAEARVAGANLFQLKVVREHKGTIAIYSTYIDGLVLGSAGLTEQSAVKEGFEIVIGYAEAKDRHPATLPGGSDGKVKLIFSKQSGIILGGQVSGGMGCGELINMIGTAIQMRMSATELETLQIATHPYLTSAPTVYPVVLAAQNASGKI